MSRIFVGLRENEEIVVAAHLPVPGIKPRAAKTLLVEAERLDHGAHGAVEHEDALGCELAQCLLDCALRSAFFGLRHRHRPNSGALPLPLRERVGVRGAGSFEGPQNLFQYAIHISNDVIIPKSQNEITNRFQHSRSVLITCLLLVMLSAIKLDDELGVRTAEFDDEAIDRHLTLEFPTVQAAIAQTKPEQTLCVGLGSSQPPR